MYKRQIRNLKQIIPMKLIKYFFGLVLIVNISSYSTMGQSIFNNTFVDIDGNEVQLSEMKGEKLTVLDFWATWCKPCIKSIPKLIQLSEEFKDSGVNFIGVNVDSPRNSSKVKPFSYSLGITYPVILDNEQVLMSDLLINSLPTLIIVNSEGEVIYTHVGYSNNDEIILKQKIEALLNG